MVCKGICIRYQATKRAGLSRYVSGQKRCSKCKIFIDWDGVHCPCYEYMLRTRPRGTETRKRLMEKMEIKRI